MVAGGPVFLTQRDWVLSGSGPGVSPGQKAVRKHKLPRSDFRLELQAIMHRKAEAACDELMVA